MRRTSYPSGEQWTIRYDDQQLVVVQVGGGIRSYTVGGRPVLRGYAVDAKADAGRGQLLMPWPNRVRDGRFAFDGWDQQLALTEPARSNATHGLVRWAVWGLAERTECSLTVAYSLLPQQGWDWPMDLQVTYELGPEGLTVTPAATNVGTTLAPFGFGAHPYLTAGEASVNELALSIPARSVLEVDERLIPTRSVQVGLDLDFARPRPIGWTALDHAFTDLSASGEVWEVSVRRGQVSTTLWANAAAYPYVQVFTGDSLPPARRRRSGVAVEPMTCPANALASGESLVRLVPGQRWSAPWGIRHRRTRRSAR